MSHPLERFRYCPVCGSNDFIANSEKSKKCQNCGFEYFMNPSSANVAFILNEKGELLVTRRKNEPAKGTLDLPGGFADIGESAEEGVIREVKEETGLIVTKATYLFSFNNTYLYSNL
ncbi:MAG: NUDIX domain-containing protein, partial [Prevotella sp.]|nr:NUDIX domain-containing protein [Prevotella sp.]MBQ5509909.1 NUDIX domain-containing protein [Prevotella sp.]